jgi:hypothetical protein
MIKTIIEVVKANKKGILKKTLIIGGSIGALAIAAKVIKPLIGKEEGEPDEACDSESEVASIDEA